MASSERLSNVQVKVKAAHVECVEAAAAPGVSVAAARRGPQSGFAGGGGRCGRAMGARGSSSAVAAASAASSCSSAPDAES